MLGLLFNATARASWLCLILSCKSSIRLENVPNAVFSYNLWLISITIIIALGRDLYMIEI
jgi:hypothetical protein